MAPAHAPRAQVIGPEVEKLVEQAPEHQAFLEEHDEAASAAGSYTTDGDTLTFTFGESSFACDGPREGDEGVFMIVELGDTTLIMQLDGEDEPLEFERVGDGDGLEGSWQLGDGEFIITFNADGTVVASGGQDCDERDGPGEDSYYSEEGCLIAPLPRTAMIEVDGRFGDWMTRDVVQVSDDDDMDADIEVAGADLSGMRLAASEEHLFLLLETHEELDESFQGGNGGNTGMYEVTLRHDGGERGGTFMMMIMYDAGQERWNLRGNSEGVELARASRGFEISVAWATLDGATQLFEADATSRACNDGPESDCPIWDDGVCFGEAGQAGE